MYFSVIVPIYNVGEYINDCLSSLRAQSFEDFEIILVDDGSTDNCGRLCDAFATDTPNATVIHKQNGGLVSARKAGLAKARGKYIINLDGDDSLSLSALSRLHELAIQNYEPDIISFALARANQNENEPHAEGFYNRQDIIQTVFPKLLLDIHGKRVHHYLCGKAIKRELQVRYQFDVPNAISYGEDTCCTTPIYFDCQSLLVTYDPLYIYNLRAGSESALFKLDRFNQLCHTVNYLTALTPPPELKDYWEQIDRHVLMTCFIFIIMCINTGQTNYFKEITEYLKDDILSPHLKAARFEGFTRKTNIVLSCIRNAHPQAAYYIYKLSEDLKRLIKK